MASLSGVQQSITEHETTLRELEDTRFRTIEELTVLSADRDRIRSLLSSEINAALSISRDSSTGDRLSAIAAEYAIRSVSGMEPHPADVAYVRPPWLTFATPSTDTVDPSSLPSVLESAAEQFGQDVNSIRTLDVLARAAQIPVLLGPEVTEAIEAYAYSMAGGCVYRHNVDPTAISLDDLWRNPGTRELTAAADAWRKAEECPDTYIVLLIDGLDGAARFWFGTLCELFRVVRERLAARHKLFARQHPSTNVARPEFRLKGADFTIVWLNVGFYYSLLKNDAHSIQRP